MHYRSLPGNNNEKEKKPTHYWTYRKGKMNQHMEQLTSR